jgi:hypothetical protein
MIRLVTHLGPAEPASVFIPVSVRQHEEQKFSDLHRPATGGAVKLHGLEFIKIGLPFSRLVLHGLKGLKGVVFHTHDLRLKGPSNQGAGKGIRAGFCL